MFARLKNKLSGATLIEAMTVLFVFSIISLTFYSVWSIGLRHIIESKNKMGATALLNEKMEIIRNLPYTSIGNTAGSPTGNIPASETRMVNTREYAIETQVDYKDDPFDGLAADGTDDIPNDYKTVRIEISWPGPTGDTSSVVGAARFVPPGLEVEDLNTGILSINVLDSGGAGVFQSEVHLVNSTVSPAKDITRYTDIFGNIMIIGLPQSIGEYHLTVSKSGYETIDTLSLSQSADIPIDSYADNHASVVTGVLSSKTIYQDRLADLQIRSEDASSGDVIASVNYHIKGGRKLGTTTIEGITVDVFNLDQTDSTSSGEKNYLDKSHGMYFLSDIESVAGYTLIGVDQMNGYNNDTQTYEFSLLPDTSEVVRVRFANNTEPTLLVKVLDTVSNLPINGATVRVTNALGYDESIEVKNDGVAFFPANPEPLAGEYVIDVSASGYQSGSRTVTINQLTSESVSLNLN